MTRPTGSKPFYSSAAADGEKKQMPDCEMNPDDMEGGAGDADMLEEASGDACPFSPSPSPRDS